MSIPKGYRLVPVELLDRALFSIMEQGFECDGLYELVHIQKLPSQPIYDEAKERELFDAWFTSVAGFWQSGGLDGRKPSMNGWLACAQSRAKAGEDA